MPNTRDSQLINRLTSLSQLDNEYWSFKGKSKRNHCHALIQYPAMMVPQMQGALIDAVLSVAPETNTVFDPFVGSGTTLGESLTRGLNFYGNDINPLAILACQVKAGPFFTKALVQKSIALLEHINRDTESSIEADFPTLNKWFTLETQINLSKIKRAIQKEPSLWARKVFWLTMSSTIRATCNSRRSTYKLHIKASSDIGNTPSVIEHFANTLNKNIKLLEDQKEILIKNKTLSTNNSARYNGTVSIVNKDIRTDAQLAQASCNLLISSPPYGDNQTTVPYGQFSYLQLQWIDVNDIDPKIDTKILSNQNAMDSSSLGGSLKDANEKTSELCDLSKSFEKCINSVSQKNPDNIKKIASFTYDLNEALNPISSAMQDNSYMIWTLGNRRVSDIEVPLDTILQELLEAKKCSFVHQIKRDIPSKRMASKNDKVSTMTKESILIMRKL